MRRRRILHGLGLLRLGQVQKAAALELERVGRVHTQLLLDLSHLSNKKRLCCFFIPKMQ